MNSNQKGDKALGRAIRYFTSLGQTVLIPLTDSQSYDLVVDIQGSLKRVQVKSANKNIVRLRVLSSRAGGKYTIKSFKRDDYDLLYAVTPRGDYLIDTQYITQGSEITLNDKWAPFLVF